MLNRVATVLEAEGLISLRRQIREPNERLRLTEPTFYLNRFIIRGGFYIFDLRSGGSVFVQVCEILMIMFFVILCHMPGRYAAVSLSGCRGWSLN